MPSLLPVTAAAVIVIPAPLASLVAEIPWPLAPVTVPLTSISIAPPALLSATIPLKAPLIA